MIIAKLILIAFLFFDVWFCIYTGMAIEDELKYGHDDVKWKNVIAGIGIIGFCASIALAAIIKLR